MRRTFPSSGMSYRFRLWRDRRRYPWHYAEPSSVKLARITSRILRWRLFVVRYTPGDPKVLIVAECPDDSTASVLAGAVLHLHAGRDAGHPEAPTCVGRLGRFDEGAPHASGAVATLTVVRAGPDDRRRRAVVVGIGEPSG